MATRPTGQPALLGGLAAVQLGVPVGAVTVGTQLHLLAPEEAAAIVLAALITIAVAVWSGALAARAHPDPSAGGAAGSTKKP